jgi:hypothetical protein
LFSRLDFLLRNDGRGCHLKTTDDLFDSKGSPQNGVDGRSCCARLCSA